MLLIFCLPIETVYWIPLFYLIRQLYMLCNVVVIWKHNIIHCSQI